MAENCRGREENALKKTLCNLETDRKESLAYRYSKLQAEEKHDIAEKKHDKTGDQCVLRPLPTKMFYFFPHLLRGAIIVLRLSQNRFEVLHLVVHPTSVLFSTQF